MGDLSLNYGLSFEDLYDDDGNYAVCNKAFLEFFHDCDDRLYDYFIRYKKGEITFIDNNDESDLLMKVCEVIERFIISLFKIENVSYDKLIEEADINRAMQQFHKKFVKRRACEIKSDLSIDDAIKILEQHGLYWKGDVLAFERKFALLVEGQVDEILLQAAASYCLWAQTSQRHKEGVLFVLPSKVDDESVLATLQENPYYDMTSYRAKCDADFLAMRVDLSHSDRKKTKEGVYQHLHYCIYCHNRGKDSCSHGLHKRVGAISKNTDSNVLDGKVKPENNDKAGCPLNQKISEMNKLKAEGKGIAALAIAMIDNPLLIATGHRICNDCAKACIYQKQTPVDIPMIETQLIEDILSLEWGFEIYSLLTRWHPLSKLIQRDAENRVALVVGLGPAGFTLAHHLLNRGAAVVGIDGMKIEYLPQHISGIDHHGNRHEFFPIRRIDEIYDAMVEGDCFGGVMKYGITARWNKKYLAIIRVMLERRSGFRMYGGIRFGSTLNFDDCRRIGFDHISLAMGAGKPQIPMNIENLLMRGVRLASDFLMALHISDMQSNNCITNIQIRMPIIVVGGGLTAVDAAAESYTYYCLQVERFLQRCEEIGFDFIHDMTEENASIAREFISHAQQLRQNPADQRRLLQKWGGVHIMYHKKITESAAWKVNREELLFAMEEGVQFVENASVTRIKTDKYGACDKVVCARMKTDAEIALDEIDDSAINNGADKSVYEEEISAKTVLIATGTNHNIYAASEMKSKFMLQDDISVFGDMHPQYFGSVVKAMASAKDGVNDVVSVMKKVVKSVGRSDIFHHMDENYRPKVVKIDIDSNNDSLFRFAVQYPAAAAKFYPGHFFRIQNYSMIGSAFEARISSSRAQSLQMEPMALTGRKINDECVEFSVMCIGGTSTAIQTLKVGDPICMTGPLGASVDITAANGDAVALIAEAHCVEQMKDMEMYLQENGERVLTLIVQDVHDMSQQISQQILQCDDIANSMQEQDELKKSVRKSVRKIAKAILIGSNKFLHDCADALSSDSLQILESAQISCIVNCSMQCMMQGICGQCVQPMTKNEGYIRYDYMCENNARNIKEVDFAILNSRLMQNQVLEIQTKFFVDRRRAVQL